MLITMISYWSATGKPHYPSMDPGMTVPHISDVGAFTMKPLFIAGSVVTTIFLDLAFATERWLRHAGRLAKNTTKKEKVLSILSICFAVIGTAGLICLSIFDSYRYPNVHNICLLLFMTGYIISAVCLCWSYQILGMRKYFVITERFLNEETNDIQGTANTASSVFPSGSSSRSSSWRFFSQ